MDFWNVFQASDWLRAFFSNVWKVGPPSSAKSVCVVARETFFSNVVARDSREKNVVAKEPHEKWN